MANDEQDKNQSINSTNDKKVKNTDLDDQNVVLSLSKNENLTKGLANLNSIPTTDLKHVAGKKYEQGVIGFRRARNNLMLAIACGKAQVRYIDLKKFIALIENMNDAESATIMLQNFQDQDDNRTSKGQVLARFNPESSAIHIIQGLTGRVIRNPSDIALFDVYYLDRLDLTSFYIAAKAQISNEDTLETMIATFDGWKAFPVPIDPSNPYGD